MNAALIKQYEELVAVFEGQAVVGPVDLVKDSRVDPKAAPGAEKWIIDPKKCKVASQSKFNNSQIRTLYSQMQLLKIELETEIQTNKAINSDDKNVSSKITKLQAMSEFLKINRKKKGILMTVDTVLRFISFALWLMIASTVLSPISIIFKPVDDFLANHKVISPQYKLSTIIKRLVGAVACVVAGVQVSAEGLIDNETGKPLFGDKSYVMCFSHASNLDVFALAATTPIFHPCPGKADLYVIPFFSWILYACGVIPIHRTDQSQAIKVLDKVANDMKKSGSGDCIAIAPEGTRSKSGLILDFKSGPFYQAEGVNLPIVPTVVIGASDIWPASGLNVINATGKVFIRYLKPIDQGVKSSSDDPKDPARVANRARVAKEVRVSMLKSLLKSESNMEIDFGFRMLMYVSDVAVLAMSYVLYSLLKDLLLNKWGMTSNGAIALCVIAPLVVTALLYAFVSLQISMMKSKDKKS